jgi:hypothetical protein
MPSDELLINVNPGWIGFWQIHFAQTPEVLARDKTLNAEALSRKARFLCASLGPVGKPRATDFAGLPERFKPLEDFFDWVAGRIAVKPRKINTNRTTKIVGP